MVDNKLVIGCEEWLSLPELHIPAIKARIDSGAKTSALHAFNIQAFARDEKPWVSFSIHPLQNNRQITVNCEAPVIGKRLIKSSSGTAEKRYVIQSQVSIGNESFDIELTLTNRDAMGYRMLLGREAMQSRLIVDPSEHFLASKVVSNSETLYDGDSATKSGLKIGLLATNKKNYTNQIIIEHAESRGHEVIFLDIHECYLKIANEQSELHFTGDQNLSDLDAVIPRLPGNLAHYGGAILRHFENMGVFCLNTAESFSRAHNPLLCLQLLKSYDLPIPRTAFSVGPDKFDVISELVGEFPIIVKPLNQNYRPTRCVTTIKSLGKIFSKLEDSENLLLQQYIHSESQPTRYWIADGKVVASKTVDALRATKKTDSQRVLTSLQKRHQKKLALASAKALKLNHAAIEVATDGQNDAYILDIQPAPGLKGLSTKGTDAVVKKLFSLIESQTGWIGQ